MEHTVEITGDCQEALVEALVSLTCHARGN